MSAGDMFGLEREIKIVNSGVRNVFTPHSPIQSAELFFGRQKEVRKIIEHINTPGQHALLYGDRGVGKSSLANVATQVLISKIIQGKLYPKSCGSSDTFQTVVSSALTDLGAEINIESKTKTHKQFGKAGLKIPVAEAGVASERTTTTKYRSQNFTASVVAEFLRDKKGLLCIDEADRIQSEVEKVELAELIKLLSDNGSSFKVLIVGVAETAAELTGGHPSVNRCLRETQLRRMADSELRGLITEGAKKVNLTFAESVVGLIVQLSSGYPHFTHLLALKCGEEAIATDLPEIDRNCLAKAIRSAVEDAEGTLRRQYDDATRSHSTEMYKIVLLAASRLRRDEFSAVLLRETIETITQEPISQGSLNNFLQRLVSDDYTSILHRCSKGVYKFADPRMPSFVRIANEELLEEEAQSKDLGEKDSALRKDKKA